MYQNFLVSDISKAFNLEELKTLCFDLGLNFDELPGDRLSRKVESLIVEFYKSNRIPDLFKQLLDDREHVVWPTIDEAEQCNWEPLRLKVEQPELFVQLLEKQIEPRLRTRLIAKMRRNWIDGFLNASVHRSIQLEMQEKSHLVHSESRPWDLHYHASGQQNQLVKTDEELINRFDESNRSLLILGAPGSGKTITLLQLCEELLTFAERDRSEKIPMVFNLASWAIYEKDLEEWLADEAKIYTLSKSFMLEDLIVNEQIILMLDGLDEVEESKRGRCVEAINRFKQKHMVPLVICCRSNEFADLEEQLNVGGALEINTLTDAQIDRFLIEEGESMGIVRDQMVFDEELRELGRTPLLLSLMPIAYVDLTAAELDSADGIEKKRKKLFEHYVQKVFAQRPLQLDHDFTKDDALNWLGFLASNLARTNQQQFYIEFLDDSWLHANASSNWAKFFLRCFLSITVFIVLGLIFSPIRGVWIWMTDQPTYGGIADFIIAMILGVFVNTLAGLIIGVILGTITSIQRFKGREHLIETFRFGWSGWPSFKNNTTRGFGFGFVFGFLAIIADTFWIASWPVENLGYDMLLSLIHI